MHQGGRFLFSRTNQNGCGLMISLLCYNTRMLMPSLVSSVVSACANHNTRGTRGANVPGLPHRHPLFTHPHPTSICKSMQHATSTDDTSRLRNICNLSSAWAAERQKAKAEKSKCILCTQYIQYVSSFVTKKLAICYELHSIFSASG